MTDEQPWREWDEYTRLMVEAQDLVIDGVDHGNLDWKYERPDHTRIAPNIDALCARVWREAGMAHIPLQDALYRTKARAEAAEARVVVLEEALEEVEQIARLKLAQARAALADVPDDRARRRDEAYRAMVEALRVAEVYVQRNPGEGAMELWRMISAALALARQVEA